MEASTAMRGLLLGAFAASAACTSVDANFVCADSSQCVRQGAAGRCELSDFCSFGDATCPSEWRYADPGAGALSGTCSDAGSAYASTVLGDIPVAYWRLGDPPRWSTLLDATGRGHAGTPTGGASLGAPPLIVRDADQAVRFDGTTGYVAVADAPDLELSGVFSVEAWFEADTFTLVDGGFPTLLQKGTTANTGYAIMVSPAGPNLLMNVEDNVAFLGLSTLDAGERYHVVGTFDGTWMRLYLNGQEDGAHSVATGTLPLEHTELDIGRRPDGANHWDGVIDEVAVYRAALTPQQILNHYIVGSGQ